MIELNPDITACFTGHRSLPLRRQSEFISNTDTAIAHLYEQGYKNFIAGGAVGYDTLAACRVVIAKRNYSDVNLILALPCRNQTERWTSENDLKMYKFLLGAADDVIYTSQFYDKGCMQIRNRWMVDHSSVCIAYCTSNTGGTASTVRYAKRNNLRVINVAKNNEYI